jgi:predicted secreted protein
MNRKILAVVLVFLCLAVGCATSENPKGEVTATPVITQSFASTEIKIGDTWKIYLNASDPGLCMMSTCFGLLLQLS